LCGCSKKENIITFVLSEKKKKKKKKKKKEKEKENLILRAGGQPGNKNAEKWTEEKALEIGNSLIAWLKVEPEIIKTLNGRQIENINLYKIEFLSRNGFTKDLIRDLCSRFISFHDLIKEADEIQEAKILKYSALNKINPTISIFCLKNHHGYKDKSEMDMTTKGESLNANNLTIEQINEKLAKLDAIQKRD